MGKSIVYCDGCGVRLLDEDFAKGRAVGIENRSFCASCRPAAKAAAPMPSSSSRIPLSGLTPRRAMSAVPARPPSPKAAALWGLLGAGVVLLVGVLAFVMKSDPPPAPAPVPQVAPPPVVKAPSPPLPDPAEKERRRAQFLADVRAVIRDTKDLEAKRADIDARIREAEIEEGPRPEFKELRAELKAAIEKAKEPPGLLGHWRMDEVADGKTPDATSNGLAGAVKGKAATVPGRVGGALEFDGSGGHVELPKTDALHALQKGSYTLALWYRPTEAPTGKSGKENAYAHGLLMKAGAHSGLEYVTGTRFFLDHWLAPTGHAFASGTTVSPAGRWAHVAGVVDRDGGEVRLFVDGKRDLAKPYAKGAEGKDYGTTPWRIGIANPGAKEYRYPSKGAFDEVRIYDRALSDEEVARLFSAAK